MSFLVIGSNYVSLYFANLLKEYGFKVNVITKRFNDKKDLVLLPRFFFEQMGFDEKGIIKKIEYIEVKDLYENSKFYETNTYLVDLNFYRNKLLNNLELYDNAEIIDKNGENVFIKVNNKGTLIKAKYILDFENTYKSNIVKKIQAIVKAKIEDSLFFLNSGYGVIINLVKDKYLLQITSKNAEYDFNNFINSINAQCITKKTSNVVLHQKGQSFINNDLYMIGEKSGLTNNLTLSGKIEELLFIKRFDTYIPKMLSQKAIGFNSEIYDKFPNLLKRTKFADFFWGLEMTEKNKIIKNLNPKRYILDFDTMFDNLSLKHKFKLLFR